MKLERWFCSGCGRIWTFAALENLKKIKEEDVAECPACGSEVYRGELRIRPKSPFFRKFVVCSSCGEVDLCDGIIPQGWTLFREDDGSETYLCPLCKDGIACRCKKCRKFVVFEYKICPFCGGETEIVEHPERGRRKVAEHEFVGIDMRNKKKRGGGLWEIK